MDSHQVFISFGENQGFGFLLQVPDQLLLAAVVLAVITVLPKLLLIDLHDAPFPWNREMVGNTIFLALFLQQQKITAVFCKAGGSDPSENGLPG